MKIFDISRKLQNGIRFGRGILLFNIKSHGPKRKAGGSPVRAMLRPLRQ